MPNEPRGAHGMRCLSSAPLPELDQPSAFTQRALIGARVFDAQQESALDNVRILTEGLRLLGLNGRSLQFLLAPRIGGCVADGGAECDAADDDYAAVALSVDAFRLMEAGHPEVDADVPQAPLDEPSPPSPSLLPLDETLLPPSPTPTKASWRRSSRRLLGGGADALSCCRCRNPCSASFFRRGLAALRRGTAGSTDLTPFIAEVLKEFVKTLDDEECLRTRSWLCTSCVVGGGVLAPAGRGQLCKAEQVLRPELCRSPDVADSPVFSAQARVFYTGTHREFTFPEDGGEVTYSVRAVLSQCVASEHDLDGARAFVRPGSSGLQHGAEGFVAETPPQWKLPVSPQKEQVQLLSWLNDGQTIDVAEFEQTWLRGCSGNAKVAVYRGAECFDADIQRALLEPFRRDDAVIRPGGAGGVPFGQGDFENGITLPRWVVQRESCHV